jgi:GNAT superfamily N-acetyltransferase
LSLIIRQASSTDAEVVRAILAEAAQWLRDSGRELWREDELTADIVRPDVEAGSVYLAAYGDEPAGTLRFQLTDERIWADVSQHESAFVHRLAVRRRFAGGELSSALLSWAVARTRELGRRYLRLDCDHARPRLRAVYERFGFRWHSDCCVGPFHVARYEYLVSSDGGSDT